MAEKREGETVRVTFEQTDVAGKTMWSMSSEWYGFSNKDANQFSMGMVNAVGEYIRGLNEEKYG